MYRLDMNRKKYGSEVCKTLSNPIMILDYLELKEALVGIGLIFYFGIIFTSPLLLTLLLGFLWGVWPSIRSRFERGIIVQKLFRFFGLKINGLLKPPSRQRFRA